MSMTYETAHPDTLALLTRVCETHHRALADHGVTLSVVMAAKETKGEAEHALKRHSLVIAAKIQVTPLVDRARGLADAKLTIDALTWDHLPESSRAALLDHELQHLELVDPDDDPLDDLGRPRLRLRPHDWELTGFRDVAERHGEAALEVRALRQEAS